MASKLVFDEHASRTVEAVYAAPAVAATRSQVFRALAPRRGEHIIDLGCGPGFMTLELARAAGPEGSVHGIDLSEPMLALAGARCAGLTNVRLAAGDITALDLPDGSADAAVALQALAYVPDVGRAVAELARVLRPGGRAVVLDTDFAAVVWHGRDQARVDRIFAAYEDHVAHPGLPRVLGRMAAEAGLETVWRDVIPILDVTYHSGTFAFGISRFIRDYVVGKGRVTPEEADLWLEECAALDRDRAFFMSFNRYLFAFRKSG